MLLGLRNGANLKGSIGNVCNWFVITRLQTLNNYNNQDSESSKEKVITETHCAIKILPRSKTKIKKRAYHIRL